MNLHGALVRWQLVDVQDVYEIYDDTIDPRGTEVFAIEECSLSIETTLASKKRARTGAQAT
jgi:hypothetical protein